MTLPGYSESNTPLRGGDITGDRNTVWYKKTKHIGKHPFKKEGNTTNMPVSLS
jgi:hypothetical protein